MSRNRTISPAEAVFVSTNATGTQVISQLHRIQSANYGSNITRTPVSQYGQQAAIDQVILEPASANLEISYLSTNMLNEANLGFVTDGSAQSISGFLNKSTDEKNYYVLTVPEGEDAFGGDGVGKNEIWALGNGFITNYSFSAQVGSFPTVSVSAEGLNYATYTGTSGTAWPVPSINPASGTKITGVTFTLPQVTTGVASQATALRPGDVHLILTNPSLGVDINDAKAQSVSVSVDLGREPQNKLGSAFPFSREITFPINSTMSVEANVGDLITGNLADILCDDKDYDLAVYINKPTCPGAVGADVAVRYDLKGAKLASQRWTSSIGPNKSVALEWTAQVGGPRDLARGLFFSGTLS